MGYFAKSCKEAGIRAGLYNIKFEPSLPVLEDVQKRAGETKDPFQWATGDLLVFFCTALLQTKPF